MIIARKVYAAFFDFVDSNVKLIEIVNIIVDIDSNIHSYFHYGLMLVCFFCCSTHNFLTTFFYLSNNILIIEIMLV